MNISVYGSSAGGAIADKDLRTKAKEIGKEIAQKGICS